MPSFFLRKLTTWRKGPRMGRFCWAYKLIQQGGNIFDLLGQDVGHIMGPLHAPGDTQHAPGNDSPAEAFINVTPDDDVHNACFILKREEDDPLGRSRALA